MRRLCNTPLPKRCQPRPLREATLNIIPNPEKASVLQQYFYPAGRRRRRAAFKYHNSQRFTVKSSFLLTVFSSAGTGRSNYPSNYHGVCRQTILNLNQGQKTVKKPASIARPKKQHPLLFFCKWQRIKAAPQSYQQVINNHAIRCLPDNTNNVIRKRQEINRKTLKKE